MASLPAAAIMAARQRPPGTCARLAARPRCSTWKAAKPAPTAGIASVRKLEGYSEICILLSELLRIISSLLKVNFQN